MAGVMMPGDEGVEVKTQEVAAMGGADIRAENGLPITVPVVASAHLTDGMRAEGVSYNETPGVNVTTQAYPAGTAMNDTTPTDNIN